MPCPKKVHDFGKRLKRWLYSEKGAWPLIPPSYASWVSGGCWILARSLQYWIGPTAELKTIYSMMPTSEWHSPDEELPQHVIVKVGDCYLDGDGASTERELISKWINEEMLVGPYIGDYDPQALEFSNVDCPIGVVKDLAKALYRRFGDADLIFF